MATLAGSLSTALKGTGLSNNLEMGYDFCFPYRDTKDLSVWFLWKRVKMKSRYL